MDGGGGGVVVRYCITFSVTELLEGSAEISQAELRAE